ncbi:hypothetical protein ABF86_03255 [Nitrosomonas sp. GH22]|nr:hypothetical protein [Nitrosomonas sp. GH22]
MFLFFDEENCRCNLL